MNNQAWLGPGTRTSLGLSCRTCEREETSPVSDVTTGLVTSLVEPGACGHPVSSNAKLQSMDRT